MFFTPILLWAQGKGYSEREEILLELNVEHSQIFDLDGLLHRNNLYLPVKQLLTHLKISFSYKADQSELEIYFPNPEDPAQYNYEQQVLSESNSNSSAAEVFIDEKKVYILKSRLEQLLDVQIIFDYRTLRITLFSENTLPVIKFYERKERYEKFTSSSVEFSPDVKLPAKRPLLDGWIADWSLNNSHSLNSNTYSYNLGLGGQILGGNLSVRSSGSKEYGMHWDRFRGKWSYPIYSSSLIKKVQLGDLSHSNKLGLNTVRFRGFKITNNPNATRREFDSFRITDDLNEGWDSELYVNRQLKDFALGSQTNSFHFATPLTYGSNLIQLKYYDENGLTDQRKYLILIPREFLPQGKFEYTLSGGRYFDTFDQDFGRLNLKWGASSTITLGGGTLLEFTEQGEKLLPFVQSWFRFGNRGIVKGSHTLSRLTEGSLLMHFGGSQSLFMEAKKYYRRTPIFNKSGKSLEASMNTSLPIEFLRSSFSTSVSSHFTQYSSGNQNLNIYGSISTRLPWGMNLRLRNQLMLRNSGIYTFEPAQVNSQITLSRRMLRRLMLRPSIEFNHRLQKITDSGINMSYRITSKSYLNFSFQRNHRQNNNRFQVSLKLDLPFARHTSIARFNPGTATISQSTNGSLAFNSSQQMLYTDNQRRLEKATIILDPFLDLNNNGEKDAGEPPVEGLSATIFRNGDHSPSHRKEKVIENLVPYERYHIRINDDGLNNPLWKPKYESYSMQVLPNAYNTLPVPVMITGEVSGSVVLRDQNYLSLLTGLDIHISSTDDDFKKNITTYSGGQFYYVGLNPGNYVATLNGSQLEERSLMAKRDSIAFTIDATREGDIVDGIELEVTDAGQTREKSSPKQMYAIQIGAFRFKENAEVHAALSRVKLGHEVEVKYSSKQELYKCRITDISSKDEAKQLLKVIINKPTQLYEDSFLIEMDRKNKR